VEVRKSHQRVAADLKWSHFGRRRWIRKVTMVQSSPGVNTETLGHSLARDLPDEYRRQGVIDTADRLASGLFIHAVLWFGLLLVHGYGSRHHSLFVGNALGLILAGCIRWMYHRRLRILLLGDFDRCVQVFRGLVVAHNLYWGVLCAWLVLSPDAGSLSWLIIMGALATAVAGTMAVALDRFFSVAYPAAILVPVALAALHLGIPEGIAVAGLGLALSIYSSSVSRMVGEDYWGRQYAQFLLRQRAVELAQISVTDPLTEVANRRHFQDQLERVWRDARRRQEALALCIVDLDHFKRINDTHGHPFGDLCLQAAARALRDAIRRPTDLLARYGGEEFVVVLPGIDGQGACRVAEQMLAKVHSTVVERDGHRVELRCSIGVAACVPGPDGKADQLVTSADAALYLAKERGRGRLVYQGG
jgi:diguanylate cyclase (GGDEF)-like protein